jgi:SNF2 family DNA or RNA helicase
MAIDDWYDTPVGKTITAPYVPPTAIFPTCCVPDPPHFPHQLAAYAYLQTHPDTLIHSVMRAGKSRPIIDFIANKPIADVRRVLILCPTSAVLVWEEQFQTWSGRPYQFGALCYGSTAQKQKDAQACVEEAKRRNVPAICAINYSSFWREPFWLWAKLIGWNVIVYDEIQAIAGYGSKQSKHAAQLYHKSFYHIGLSGTPFPQDYKSVYGVYRGLDQKLYGTNHARHAAEFFIMGGFQNKEITGLVNRAEFKRRLRSIRFHVPETGLKLPPLTETVIPVILPPHARRIYNDMEEDYYARVESHEITASNAAAANVKLQQICQGYCLSNDGPGAPKKLLHLHTAKQDALRDLLDGLPPREPVVIFCRFIADRQVIHTLCASMGRTTSELSGSLKTHEDWRAGHTDILICEYKAASEAQNFSRSNYIIYYSLNYSWSAFDQSKARCSIHDKTSGIGIYYLMGRNTVDYRIKRALEKRGDTMKELCEIPLDRHKNTG